MAEDLMGHGQFEDIQPPCIRNLICMQSANYLIHEHCINCTKLR